MTGSASSPLSAGHPAALFATSPPASSHDPFPEMPPPRPVRDSATGALVGALVLLLLGVGLALVAFTRPYPVVLDSPAWWTASLFGLAAIVGAALPLRARRDRTLATATALTIPFAVGLLLLPSAVVIPGYIVAALLGAVIRRRSWPESALATGLASLESGLAVAILSWWAVPLGSGDILAQIQPRLLPLAVVLAAVAAVSALAVDGVQRVAGIHQPLAAPLARSLSITVILTGLAYAGVTIYLAAPSGPTICVVLVIIAAAFYQNHIALTKQHDATAALYEFGATVVTVGGEAHHWQPAVNTIRERLGARVAVLYLVGGTPAAVVAGTGAIAATRPALDALWAASMTPGSLLVHRAHTDDPALRAAIVDRGATQAICAPLIIQGRLRGYLEVWDRQYRWQHFSDQHRRLLQTMAGHIAAAIDNDRLLTRLQYDAYHDSVTDSVNRLGLSRRADEAIEAGTYGGILLIELDVLGAVSSALGHSHGDELLITTCRRLREACGDRTVGRIDGDRFAVLLEPQSEAAARTLATQLLAETSNPIRLTDVEIEPTGIAGLCLADGPAPSHSTVLQQAQMALESARSKDEQIAVYRPTTGAVYQRRFQLVSQFRAATEGGAILLHYQPKVSLAERELIGVEALVRWKHPEYGFVPPTDLIEAIEGTTAIDILFAHVLDLALDQFVRWQQRGWQIPVAVNMSVRNLLAPGLTTTVADALERYRVPPELLCLEITESAVMAQPERSMAALAALSELGVGLSLDDFGTGYSSLAYLRRLPVDEIKVDRTFVQGMVTDLGDLAIVRAIIDLGHSLGLRVVAEGVEEEAGRDALLSMRCEAIQGFLLARPMPVDRFESWVAAQTAPVARAATASLLRLH